MAGLVQEQLVHHEVEVLVVGGGVAASTFIETLIHLRPQVKIGLVSPSPLLKQVSIVSSSGRTLDHLAVQELPAELPATVLHIKDSASGLDSRAHTLCTASQGVIKYQYLCICTGARPLLLNNLHSPSPFIVGLRDTESVDSLTQRLKDCRKILLVGNGGIATELVYELRNCHIIWVVKDDTISATFFDAATANFFLPKLASGSKTNADESRKSRTSRRFVAHSSSNAALGPDWSFMKCLQGNLDEKNITIFYGCQVKCIKENTSSTDAMFHDAPSSASASSSLTNFPITVDLSNGESINCDLIISATGVTPNVEPFLHNNNFTLAPDGAIKVNRDMETSVKDVFAAGDVCHPEWQDECELWLHMRLWTQARQMALYAAHCVDAKIEENEKLSHSTSLCANEQTTTSSSSNNECHSVESTAGHRLFFNFDIFSHVTSFFGYKVVLLGLYNGQKLNNDYKILFREVTDKQCVKVILKNGKMKGAILIGDTDLEETFENLILSQIDVSRIEEQLLDGIVDIEDYFD